MIPNKLGIKFELITAIFIRTETTPRYDHISDDMVREYFAKRQKNPREFNNSNTEDQISSNNISYN